MNSEITLYGKEQGYIESYKTLWEAYESFKDIKRQDQIENIKDNYEWYFEYDKENNHYMIPIKFYVRNNKMYYKLGVK